MTEKSYNKIEIYFRTHKKSYFLLRIIYTYLPILVYILYPVLILNTFIEMIKGGGAEDFVRTLVIPAVTFFSVTILRKIINRPRPYEALNINPLIKKDTKGKSFPSRHSASIFTIAMASFMFSPAVAVTLIILGIIMCLSRVLAGVHYISDVVCGALYSIILGLIGFIL